MPANQPMGVAMSISGCGKRIAYTTRIERGEEADRTVQFVGDRQAVQIA